MQQAQRRFADQVLSAMRFEFGGYVERQTGK
jgi:6-phosphogluconate dehydrogenase (decarboxylating)